MLFLNPNKVTLGTLELTNVAYLAFDRGARRSALEWTDLGPHVGFADVPEQRVDVTIVRRVMTSEPTAPKPGESLVLSLRAAPGASAANILQVTATVVITAVEHSYSAGGKATQTVRAVCVSTTGAADPVTETITQGEA